MLQFAELLQRENIVESEILQGEMLIILNQIPAQSKASKDGVVKLLAFKSCSNWYDSSGMFLQAGNASQ